MHGVPSTSSIALFLKWPNPPLLRHRAQSAPNKSRPDRSRSNKSQPDRSQSNKSRPVRSGSNKSRPDRSPSNRSRPDRSGSKRSRPTLPPPATPPPPPLQVHVMPKCRRRIRSRQYPLHPETTPAKHPFGWQTQLANNSPDKQQSPNEPLNPKTAAHTARHYCSAALFNPHTEIAQHW